MLFLILFFPLAESSLSFYERCRINDCSHQLQATKGSCTVYNTSMCSQVLNETHSEAFKDLTNEDEYRFKVLVFPYEVTFLDSKSPLKITYYSVNISVTIFEKGIHQVALKLTEKDVTKCRLFDFRKVSDNISFPVDLFYDCFHNFTSKYCFHLEFLSLSTKEKLSYDVIIPPKEKIRTLCDWKPSIVIFTGGLHHGTVRVKFSQAPSILNILSYEVSFIPISQKELKVVVEVPANQSETMLSVELHLPVSDTYNLTVLPLHFKKRGCPGAEVVSIRVGFFKYGKEMKILLYFCIALGGVGFLCFLKYFYTYFNNLAFQPHVLLVHALNYPEEEELTSRFSDFLIQHGCKVSSIYGDDNDPERWCRERYQECNVILIILSNGLFLTLDSEHHKPLKVCHPYCEQLIYAATILRHSEKKVCRVCFSYSSPDHTPEGMKLTTGRCFKLPNEIGSLLCFLFGYKLGIRCIKYHLGSFKNKVAPTKEFQALMKGVEAVHRASEQGLNYRDDDNDKNESDNDDDDNGEDNGNSSLYKGKGSHTDDPRTKLLLSKIIM